jgi:hypothetical protein
MFVLNSVIKNGPCPFYPFYGYNILVKMLKALSAEAFR